jgi:diadenosine tetraphosphatase ApaH/serine/threonine PP2A family protein phosphatase
MRIAIISNLEALTKAFEIIDTLAPDTIVCLGDVVGYGANPNECLALVRERCSIVLRGNHEEAVREPVEAEQFTDDAQAGVFWTRSQLTPANLLYLETLPFVYSMENIRFVHSAPRLPEFWEYVTDELIGSEMFEFFPEPICFIGHTHIPAIYSAQGLVHAINREERFLVNVGSVGQPRDRNPDLSFGFFDTESWEYQNIRSPYDVKAAAWKILQTDLPSRLGHRLLTGI